jgi:hypothetical protein
MKLEQRRALYELHIGAAYGDSDYARYCLAVRNRAVAETETRGCVAVYRAAIKKAIAYLEHEGGAEDRNAAGVLASALERGDL